MGADVLSVEPGAGGPGGKRIAYLDGWRGLAILTVLLGHFGGRHTVAAGGLGVELFFVLSGRFMAEILIVERFPLSTFFIRRFSRIYPALALFATAMLLIDFHKIDGRALLNWLASLTVWMNYLAVAHDQIARFEHLWSVSVEEHCYILLAIIAAITGRKRGVTIAIVAVIALLAALNGIRLDAAGGDLHDVYWRTDTRLFSVFSSFALYLGTRSLPSSVGILSPLALIAALPIFVLGLPHPVQYIAGTLLLALAVNTIDYAPEVIRKAFAFRPLALTGLWSFSIYLWQQPFYVMSRNVPLRAIALLPAAFVVGILSFRFIEQPARKALNRLGARIAPGRPTVHPPR